MKKDCNIKNETESLNSGTEVALFAMVSVIHKNNTHGQEKHYTYCLTTTGKNKSCRTEW